MGRFVMEHLPRAGAVYLVMPMDGDAAKDWLKDSSVISTVRTTEMITAIKAGLGVELAQSPDSVAMRPGDEALLITLSFGVLLAWAEEDIAPLPDDWRCVLLRVQTPGEFNTPNKLTAAIAEELPGEFA